MLQCTTQNTNLDSRAPNSQLTVIFNSHLTSHNTQVNTVNSVNSGPNWAKQSALSVKSFLYSIKVSVTVVRRLAHFHKTLL